MDQRAIDLYNLYIHGTMPHGLHNDSSEASYEAVAAKLAWVRTIAFFDHYLEV